MLVEQSEPFGAHEVTSHVQADAGPGQGTAPSARQESPAPVQQSEVTAHACETVEQVIGVSQIPSLQKSPPPAGSWSQQSLSRPQTWPVAAQELPPDEQVPDVAPGGTSQERPAQQSPSIVQVPALGTHGTRQIPPSHVPEQHCPPVAQAFPLGAHRAHVPAVDPCGAVQSPEQQFAAPTVHATPYASQIGGGGVVQTKPISATSTQESSSQQVVSEAPAQRVPRGLHVLPVAEQRRTPAASGTQGANPQH